MANVTNEHNDLYKIVKDVYLSGDSALNVTPTTTYEAFKMVHNPGENALNVNIIGGGTGSDTLSGLTDVTITSVSNGQLLGWNGTEWVNVSPGAASAFPLQDLTDATITSLTNGQIIQWDGSAWVNVDSDSILGDYYTKTEIDNSFLSANTSFYTQSEADANFLSSNTALFDGDYNSLTNLPVLFTEAEADNNYLSADTSITNETWVTNNFLSADTSFYSQIECENNFLSADTALVTDLNDLSDVTLTAPTVGNSLYYDGSDWKNVTLSYTLNVLTDTNLNSMSNNDILIWNSTTSKWENGVNPNTNTLVGLTDTTISSPTLNQALVYNGSEWVNATQIDTKTLENLTDTSITSPASNQWLKYDGTSWINTKIQLDSAENVTISSPTLNEVLTFNGSIWVNSGISSGTATDLDSLTDVTLTSPSTNEVLTFNGSIWVNSGISSGTATDLDSLTDVTLSSVSDGQLISYNSATTQWENIDSTIIDVTNPQSGETLVYDSGIWLNSATTVDMSNYYTSGQCDANFLSANTSYYTQTEADNNFLSASTVFTSDNIYTSDSGLTSDRTLSLSAHTLAISGSSARTYFEDEAISYVVTDDGSVVTGETNIENYSVGIQDDSNYNLSYLDINLTSGITISSNNSGQTTSGDTSILRLDSDGVHIETEKDGEASKLIMTSPNGTEYYLYIDNLGNLVTTAV